MKIQLTLQVVRFDTVDIGTCLVVDIPRGAVVGFKVQMNETPCFVAIHQAGPPFVETLWSANRVQNFPAIVLPEAFITIAMPPTLTQLHPQPDLSIAIEEGHYVLKVSDDRQTYGLDLATMQRRPTNINADQIVIAKWSLVCPHGDRVTEVCSVDVSNPAPAAGGDPHFGRKIKYGPLGVV